jgi:hypothetical protein
MLLTAAAKERARGGEATLSELEHKVASLMWGVSQEGDG